MGRKTSAAPKRRRRLTRSTVKQFLDLSASELEGKERDGELSSLSEMSSAGSKAAEDSDNPLVIDDNLGADTDDEPVKITSGPTAVKRKRLHRLAADPDEEVPILDPDDSMYSRSAGLKAALLGPPLQTRSAKTTSNQDILLNNTVPSKKKRRKIKSPARIEETVDRPSTVASKDRAISWSPTPPPGWASSSQANRSETQMVTESVPSADKPDASVNTIGTYDSAVAPTPSNTESNVETTVSDPSVERPAAMMPTKDTRIDRMEIMLQAQNAQLQQLMSLIAAREASVAIPPKTIASAPLATVIASKVPATTVTAVTERTTIKSLAPAFKEDKPAPTNDSPANEKDAVQFTEAPQTPQKPKDKGKARAPASDDDLNIPDDFRGLEFDIISVFSPKKNKDANVENAPVHSNQDESPSPQKKKKSVVYSDVVYPRVKYTYKGPCQVFRQELQDPLLSKVYGKAPSLLAFGDLLASYDPGSQDPSGSIGGHLSFSIWPDLMTDANPVTILHAVSVVAYGSHVNGSLANPSDMCIMPLPGVKSYQIIGRDERPAVFMSAGMCTESHLIEAEGSSSNSPRYTKNIGLMMHNLHYERFVQFCLICLGHKTLHTAMRNRALLIQSNLSPMEGNGKDQPKAMKKANKLTKFFDSPGGGSSKTAQAKGPTPAWEPGVSYPEKYKLEYNDDVPAYDARGVLFNFQSDLANLSKLKAWEGEVPIGAFVVVGHSVSTYKGAANGVKGMWHLGNNLLWVVVCGTMGDESDAGSEPEIVE